MSEELEALIAEQRSDDTDVIKPEFPEQVPFTSGLANCIGTDEDGEIVACWPRPPKGTLLVGTAIWHGTYYGYKRKKCRCQPCTGANREVARRQRQSDGS